MRGEGVFEQPYIDSVDAKGVSVIERIIRSLFRKSADQIRGEFYIHQIQYAKGVSYPEAESLYLKKSSNNSGEWGRMHFPNAPKKTYKSLMKTIRLPKPNHEQEIDDFIRFIMPQDGGFA